MGIARSIPSAAISYLTICLVLKKKLMWVSPLCLGRQGGRRLLQTRSFRLCAFRVSPVVPVRSSAKASFFYYASCLPGLCFSVMWCLVLRLPCSQWVCDSACSLLQAEVSSISQQGLALVYALGWRCWHWCFPVALTQ